MISVGLDLHKKTAQVAAMDKDGTVLFNRKIPHTREAIKVDVDRLPKHAKYVIESSSVWEETYRYMAEDLGLDVILSNPYTTMLIAKSKKKTDKVDAAVLADMLRGNYIPPCYVPDSQRGRYPRIACPARVSRPAGRAPTSARVLRRIC